MGVFDVSDLVDVLVGEKCQDVVVMAIPEELGYVDHMVIVTCMSKRHLRSAATFVKKMYKLKRQKLANRKSLGERVPRIEGIDDADSKWLALDLGNIALHLFLAETRELYDLESLWGVGPEATTDQANEQENHISTSSDELDDLIKQSHSLLADLEPAKSDLKS